MSEVAALYAFVVLSLTAALHVYWAFGGLWPADTTAGLVATVIGTERSQMPARGVILLVAGLIAVAGVVPLVRVGLVPIPVPPLLERLAVAALALVFVTRGAVSYTPLGHRIHTAEPFATLNRRYFSPLILSLALAFVLCL